MDATTIVSLALAAAAVALAGAGLLLYLLTDLVSTGSEPDRGVCGDDGEAGAWGRRAAPSGAARVASPVARGRGCRARRWRAARSAAPVPAVDRRASAAARPPRRRRATPPHWRDWWRRRRPPRFPPRGDDRAEG